MIDWFLDFQKTNRIWKVINFIDFDEKNTDVFYKWLSYNFDKTFFQNYKNLFKQISLPNMINFFNNENSSYTDTVSKSKNTYLSIAVISECENVLYSLLVRDICKNVLNSIVVNVNSENIYFSAWVLKSYKVFYSKYITNCNNIWFCSNLIWCSECISCDDLENKKYCIENKEYKKEEYLEKKKEILKDKKNYLDKYLNIKAKWKNLVSKNVDWNYVVESENVENGYFVNNVFNWKNLVFVWWIDWNSWDVWYMSVMSSNSK